MRGREPIVPQRRRNIPSQFSWVDHRFIRDDHIKGRSMSALALYLFLVTVADADGLSWYSDSALCGLLSWTATQLQGARAELVNAELVAYRKPLYQVLDLTPNHLLHSEGPAIRSVERNLHPQNDDSIPIGPVLQNILAHMQGGAR